MKRKGWQNLAILVRRKRGERGLRAVAKEIGISPATLMRVEEGRVPDLETFAKVCKWLEVDPGEFLGFKPEAHAEQRALTAHFKVDRALKPETAAALGRMVVMIAGSQDAAEQPPDVDT